MMFWAAAALAACLAVDAGSDHILARDLAQVFPRLAASAPATPVALAPAAGVRRVFGGAELRRMGARWNEPPAAEEVCFERPAAPLERERMLDVMRKSLPEGAEIELLDWSRAAAPEGELEFPAAGLRSAGALAWWRGWVRYAGVRRFWVWAKVRAAAPAARVVAAGELPAGRPVDAARLRVDTTQVFPGARGFAAEPAEVAGRIPRRTVAPGTVLRKEWFDAARDVARGDTVQVEVVAGAARLQVEGRAESSGAVGDRVVVRNPESGKRFPAVVEGKGKVSVGKAGL
jgi:flagella basal body P-ring formation protein FlgA